MSRWWRTEVEKDAGNDNVVTLGAAPTIENRIHNVKSAQALVTKLRDELQQAVADLNRRSAELAEALNELDASVTVRADTITAQQAMEG